jgi:hypothetical protein
MRSDIELALTLHFFRGIGLGTWIMRRPSRLSVKGGANLQVDRPSIQNGPVSISIRVGYPGSHEGGATPETLGDRVCLFAAHASLGHDDQPDQEAAIKQAIEEFGVPANQRDRLMAQRRD